MCGMLINMCVTFLLSKLTRAQPFYNSTRRLFEFSIRKRRKETYREKENYKPSRACVFGTMRFKLWYNCNAERTCSLLSIMLPVSLYMIALSIVVPIIRNDISLSFAVQRDREKNPNKFVRIIHSLLKRCYAATPYFFCANVTCFKSILYRLHYNIE